MQFCEHPKQLPAWELSWKTTGEEQELELGSVREHGMAVVQPRRRPRAP